MDTTLVLNGEYVHVHVQGTTYEEAITLAMHRLKEFVPDAAVVRTREEAGVGAWYVSGALGEVSLGGQMLSLQVVLACHRGDE